MSLPGIDQLVALEDDAHIQRMMLANGKITPAEAPPGPNDTAIFFLQYEGYQWLAIRFYDPDDAGYLAYGLPQIMAEPERMEIFAVILSWYAESAFQNTGEDPFLYSQFTDFPNPLCS